MSDLENKETCQETASVTSVRISDDVVATIAAIAAGEIDGVGGMCGSRAGDIIEKLGKKNSARGVKVEVENGNVKINMNLLASYGYKIQTVCEEVQAAVKSSVEGMTGLHVSEVSIVVQGIVSAGKEEETAPEKEE